MDPNRPKMRQNGTHTGSRWAPDGPRGPRMAARGSKRATRRLQDVPRWPQEAPRWHQGSPRRSQDGLIRRHKAPKMASRGTHEVQMGGQNDVLRKNREYQQKRCFSLVFSMKMTLEELKMAPISIDFGQFGLILTDLG